MVVPLAGRKSFFRPHPPGERPLARASSPSAKQAGSPCPRTGQFRARAFGAPENPTALPPPSTPHRSDTDNAPSPTTPSEHLSITESSRIEFLSNKGERQHEIGNQVS